MNDYNDYMNDDVHDYILNEIKNSKKNHNMTEDYNDSIYNNLIKNKPIDIKNNISTILNYKYSISSTQGYKNIMENKFIIDKFLDNPIFILLDGYNGNKVSDYCQKNCLRILKIVYNNIKIDNTKEFYHKLFSVYINTLDTELKKYSMEHNSASTITIIYILNDFIISVNLGDTKGILLYDNFSSIELTKDHKPYIPLEKKRIVKAHGNIINNKINNDIQISRALGAFRFKQQVNLKDNEQLISNEPYINVYSKKNNEKYIILATNGIWNYMTNQKIINFIQTLYNKNIDNINTWSKQIIEYCIENESLLNTTLIIIKCK